MEKILCFFGDSILAGDCDKKMGGYFNRLENFFKKENFVFYNSSIAGNTTKDLLERFDFDFGKIENYHENVYHLEEIDSGEYFLFFGIGINDSKHIGPNKENRVVDIENFEKNLEKLILKAKDFSKKIIFIGLTKVDEKKTMPTSWQGKETNVFFSQENINFFNQKIKEICLKNNLDFIEILYILENEDLSDGVHPNEKGHEKIFLEIKKYLEKI